MNISIRIILALYLIIVSTISMADYKDDIGYTKLATELGINLPDGSGVLVSQTEADTDGVAGPPYNYFPDTTDSQFLGKTIVDVTNLSNQPSSHATGAGRLFYGTNSIASGITNIYVYEVNNWFQAGYLRFGYSTKPLSSPGRIGSHSWVGNTGNLTYDSDILKRLDWVIETDEFIQFVGTKNSTTLNSNLLSAAYNAIAVGKTNGSHSTGSAQIDSTYVSGRTRTEIVAPFSGTSSSTPTVAATAAILIEMGNTNPGLSAGSTSNRNGDTIYNAERSETIRASLLAGADRLTKNINTPDDISDYRVAPANQSANGLDARFGAGQVNVYNSYHIIAAGEQNSNEDDGSGTGNIGVYGFDYDPSFGGSSGSNNIASYYFSTGADPKILSSSLAWNIKIAGGNRNFDGTATFYDLDLLLYDVTGSQTLVMSSTSQIDNSENIWTSLQAGRSYLLQVIPKAGQSNFQWDYALAWQIATDTDGDGISDTQEIVFGTNPLIADTDGDSLLDMQEIVLSTDPLLADTDGDGLSDFDEVNMDGDPTTYTPGVDTDPNNPDTDGDTYGDGIDVFPLNPAEWLDTDGDGIGNNADLDDDNDGLTDAEEAVLGTDPLIADTDGDGYGDGEEVTFGSNPFDNTSLPIAANGDLNNDGIVNVVDVMIGQQILNGQVIPTIEQLHYADVAPLVGGIPASDGVFNVGDLVVIQRMATGLVSF